MFLINGCEFNRSIAAANWVTPGWTPNIHGCEQGEPSGSLKSSLHRGSEGKGCLLPSHFTPRSVKVNAVINTKVMRNRRNMEYCACSDSHDQVNLTFSLGDK